MNQAQAQSLRSKLISKSYVVEGWITDHYESWPKPIRDWWDQVDEPVVARQLCSIFGHVPERDHCGMPEHDCCAWCQKLMPFQAGDVPGRLLKRLHWLLKDPELSAQITEKLGEDGLTWKGPGG